MSDFMLELLITGSLLMILHTLVLGSIGNTLDKILKELQKKSQH